jgi:hypothetical protein
MKLIPIAISALLVTVVGAFGQGKVAFANDSLHLVYYDPGDYLRPGDAALAGQGVSSGLMPAGVTLVADLYAGSSSTSLSLVSTTAFSVTVGRFASINNLVLPSGLPGGTPQFFQIQIRDNAFATAEASAEAGSYSGESSIFTMIPGSSIAYNSIVNPGTPANSTWAPGTFDMSAQSGLSGARGVILVDAATPEPCELAIWLLGIGLLVRRSLRK